MFDLIYVTIATLLFTMLTFVWSSKGINLPLKMSFFFMTVAGIVKFLMLVGIIK